MSTVIDPDLRIILKVKSFAFPMPRHQYRQKIIKKKCKMTGASYEKTPQHLHVSWTSQFKAGFTV